MIMKFPNRLRCRYQSNTIPMKLKLGFEQLYTYVLYDGDGDEYDEYDYVDDVAAWGKTKGNFKKL